MVFTETLSIHTYYIGAIRKNKEQLKIVYNVDIDIREKGKGFFPECDISGSTKDIRNCKKAVEIVLDQAVIERQDYKRRERRRNNVRPRNQFKLPEMIKSNKKRTNANPFSALEGLDEVETKHDVDAQDDANSYDQSFPSLNKYDSNISWGDISDDE